LFERYDLPVQLNIGTLHGGVMPAMVPDEAVLEGGVGFLPNKSLAEVEQDLHRAILGGDDPWLKEHYTLRFARLRNDAYGMSPDHPLPQTLLQCCKDSGVASDIFGWNVSCDARLYAKPGGMPVVIFGPGLSFLADRRGWHNVRVVELRRLDGRGPRHHQRSGD
jgi:acetylornithine deacetylase